MNHWGKDRFCIHCQKPRPSDTFRPLPGLKVRREVCGVCYSEVMANRKRVKG